MAMTMVASGTAGSGSTPSWWRRRATPTGRPRCRWAAR
jgi:hypothetical protein